MADRRASVAGTPMCETPVTRRRDAPDPGSAGGAARSGSPGGRSRARAVAAELAVLGVLTAGIVATRAESYLLFHALAETISIVIALTVFSIAWNTRRTLDSPFLLVIGLAFGPAALIDLLHTLAFKGMGVFPGTSANLATQLWVAGRVVAAAGIATALLVGHRCRRAGLLLAAFGALAAALLLAIFAFHVFPICYRDGRGLTGFKRDAEYLFIVLQLVAFLWLRRRRTTIAPTLYPYLSGAVLLLALQETCFVLYQDVYGLLNLSGHVVKIGVTYLLYSGVVRFGFTEPQETLFHSLSALNRRLAASAEDLRASRERLQCITDNLAEAVVVVAEDGAVRFANPAAVRLLTGDGSVPVAGAAPRIDDRLRVRGPQGEGPLRDAPFWTRAIADHLATTVDLVLVAPGNRTVEVSCSASPMTGDGGEPQVILSFRDVGVLNRVHRQAAQAEHLAGIGRLATGIAHEINTPAQYVGDNLTFIAEGVQTLTATVRAVADDPALCPAVRETLARPDTVDILAELPQAVAQSQDGLGQIIRIVRSMREFSHPGTPDFAAVDVNHALETTLTVSRNVWRHVSRIDLRLDPDLPLVRGLSAELNQAFLNLVVNAAQAIESSGKPLPGRITVSTAYRDGMVEVRIGDTGTGVPPGDRDRIFDLFFTTRPAGQGTGQGLALCRDVITLKHGGTLELAPGEGEGATFVVRLPALRPQDR